MRSPVQRHDPVRLFARRLMLLALFILAIIALSGVWNIYQKERESSALKQQAQAQFADLETREQQLHTDIATLKTDRGMEAALRQQYTMGKSGEKLIVIIDPATTTPTVATSSAIQQWIHHALPWW